MTTTRVRARDHPKFYPFHSTNHDPGPSPPPRAPIHVARATRSTIAVAIHRPRVVDAVAHAHARDVTRARSRASAIHRKYPHRTARSVVVALGAHPASTRANVARAPPSRSALDNHARDRGRGRVRRRRATSTPIARAVCRPIRPVTRPVAHRPSPVASHRIASRHAPWLERCAE